MLTRRYNIYEMMMRGPADRPGGGGADDDQTDDGSDTSNAKTINHDDPEDPPVDEEKDKDGKPLAAKAGDDEAGEDGAEDKSGEDDGKPAPKTVPRDIMLRRVGQLTGKNKELADQIKARDDEIARLKAAGQNGDGEADDGNDDGTVPQRNQFKSQAEFEAAVADEANRRLAIREFNTKCDGIAEVGETTFGKEQWADTVENLRTLGDDGNIPIDLLNAAFAADDAAAVLHHLGQHPEEADKILRMPPVQRIAAVVKLGLKPAAAKPKPRSKAPEPVEPIGGAGGKSGDAGLSDDVDDATWLKNRQSQVNAKAAGGSR